MTDKDVKMNDIHETFFNAVHQARHHFISDMGEQLAVNEHLTIHDIMQMAVEASGILSSVQLSNVRQDCIRIGKETGEVETSEKLLADIISTSAYAELSELLPDMLGKKMASNITFKLISSTIKRLIKDHPASATDVFADMMKDDKTSATKPFSEIITDMKRH